MVCGCSQTVNQRINTAFLLIYKNLIDVYNYIYITLHNNALSHYATVKIKKKKKPIRIIRKIMF